MLLLYILIFLYKAFMILYFMEESIPIWSYLFTFLYFKLLQHFFFLIFSTSTNNSLFEAEAISCYTSVPFQLYLHACLPQTNVSPYLLLLHHYLLSFAFKSSLIFFFLFIADDDMSFTLMLLTC